KVDFDVLAERVVLVQLEVVPIRRQAVTGVAEFQDAGPDLERALLLGDVHFKSARGVPMDADDLGLRFVAICFDAEERSALGSPDRIATASSDVFRSRLVHVTEHMDEKTAGRGDF